MLFTWIVRRLAVLALILAVPTVAGEFLARKLIGDAVTSAVRARIGVAPTVSLGSSPILLQLIRGRLDTATVTAAAARIGGLPPMMVTATLRDLHVTHLTSLQGAIGSLRVSAGLAPAAVRALLATPTCIESLPAYARAGLTRNPRVYLQDGRIDLLPPAGRAVEVRLRPAAAGDQLTFELSALERAAVPAPPAALAATQAQIRCGRSLTHLPFGVALVSATARSGRLELWFAASDAGFTALG